MKNFLVLLGLLILCGCKVGEFTPKRHALYDQGRPDCEAQPDRCIKGVPW